MSKAATGARRCRTDRRTEGAAGWCDRLGTATLAATLLCAAAALPAAQAQTVPPMGAQTVPQMAAPAASPDRPTMITVPNVLDPSVSAGQTVQRVRSGEHGYYTRIVLDVSGPVAFSYGLSANRQGVVVEVPQVRWTGAPAGTVPGGPRVEGWRVLESSADGTRLVIVGRRPLHVLRALPLPPERGRGYRLVLDLAEWAGPLSTAPATIPGRDGW